MRSRLLPRRKAWLLPALHSLFMWRRDSVGVAHFIMACWMSLVPSAILLMMRLPHRHLP